MDLFSWSAICPLRWAPSLPASGASPSHLPSEPESGQGHRGTSPPLPCPGHPWSRNKSSTAGTRHTPGQGSPEVTPVPRYSVWLQPSIFNDFSFLHTTLFIFHFPYRSCWALLTRREKKTTFKPKPARPEIEVLIFFSKTQNSWATTKGKGNLSQVHIWNQFAVCSHWVSLLIYIGWAVQGEQQISRRWS